MDLGTPSNSEASQSKFVCARLTSSLRKAISCCGCNVLSCMLHGRQFREQNVQRRSFRCWKTVPFKWSATWGWRTATTMTRSRNVSNNVTRLKVGEPLEDYVGELRMLVEKAYSNWTTEQQEVLVGNQFIQGYVLPLASYY